MNWQGITALVASILVLLFGISLIEPAGDSALRARTVLEPQPASEGFARAIGPWDWQFPRDHGPHPEFQTEWWYYTGNLAAADGRRFGFQFTVFRRALEPQARHSESEFRSNDLYMAHLTLSDVAGGRFLHDLRYSRGGAGLAGATVEPRYRVWLEDWELRALDDEATVTQLRAANEDFALDIQLQQVKPPALQGDRGLSAKSLEVGNASYYYSLSRLLTQGQLSIDGQRFELSGDTWMDHEFSTSALGTGAQGWDWFGLIFDDGSELMVGQIRLTDGGIEPAFGGLLIAADGSTRALSSDEIRIRATSRWTSPHSGAEYPASWDIVVGSADLRLRVLPLLDDQELYDNDLIYWEGAVQVSGDKTGYGYAELTGYASSMQDRF